MKIEVEFCLGEDVFFMENNKIVKSEIKGIDIKYFFSQPYLIEEMIVSYDCRIDNELQKIDQKKLFSSKEDLCDNLMNK
jgi:hypothetical protein